VVGGNSCLVEGEVDIDLGTSAVRLIRMATAEVNVCYAMLRQRNTHITLNHISSASNYIYCASFLIHLLGGSSTIFPSRLLFKKREW
jgi:hypothetical protein